MKVGIRETKNRLSKYLKLVKEGKTIIITERNTPVAKLVPVQENELLPVLPLIEQKIASWQGGKPGGIATPPVLNGIKSIAAMVAEDRR
mgnify:CR=1 FL=1